MTTATDWEVRDADTGSQAVVTDVDVTRLPGDAPVMPMEDVHKLAEQNARLRQLVDRLTDDKCAAYTDVERLSAELDTLREQVGPLDERWTPPTEQPTAWIEEQTIAHRAATHRPSADTHTYIADLHRQDRQRWESVHDNIEALTAHEPADVWDDELRALLQPVETDWWEREDRLMVGLVTREQESVYAELAPDRLDDDRVQRMIDDPETYFREARERATPDRPDVENMLRVSKAKAMRDAVKLPPHMEPKLPEPEPWWRRHADVIAGVAIGAGMFAVLGVAYVTGVLA